MLPPRVTRLWATPDQTADARAHRLRSVRLEVFASLSARSTFAFTPQSRDRAWPDTRSSGKDTTWGLAQRGPRSWILVGEMHFSRSCFRHSHRDDAMARFLLISLVQDWLRSSPGALLEYPRRAHCAHSRRLWLLRHAGQRLGASGRERGGDARHVARGACVVAAIDRDAADSHPARDARTTARRLCGRVFASPRTTASSCFAAGQDAYA